MHSRGNTRAQYVLILLHGFSSNGPDFAYKIEEYIPEMVKKKTLRLYPSAPLRRITCYNNTWHRSWHNYITSYGDHAEPIEEEIDETHIRETRERILKMIRDIRISSRFPVLIGESQGACVAIDVSCSMFPDETVPVISMYGQRYSVTPRITQIPIYAFWSLADLVIAASLVERSFIDMKLRRKWIDESAEHADAYSAAPFLKQTLIDLVH